MAALQCSSTLPGFKYRQCPEQKLESLYLIGKQKVQKYPIYQDQQIGFTDRFWGELISNDMDQDNESTEQIVESGIRRGVKILMKIAENSKGKTTNHTDCEESYFSVQYPSPIHLPSLFQKKTTTFSEIHLTP